MGSDRLRLNQQPPGPVLTVQPNAAMGDLNDGLRVLACEHWSVRGRTRARCAALRQYLRREHRDPADGEDALLEMIGLVDEQDGPDDVAMEHDRYLYGASRST